MYSLAVVDDFAKPDLDDPVYSVELVQNNLPWWPFVSLEIGIMIYSPKFLSAFLTLQGSRKNYFFQELFHDNNQQNHDDHHDHLMIMWCLPVRSIMNITIQL